MSFGRELVVVDTKLRTIFGKFSVHVGSRCGGLNEEHSISIQWRAKLSLALHQPILKFDKKDIFIVI